jgi:glycosyltransferase involved in cell wall biosynthesis
VHILAVTVDYPPHRFIGSELMTHRLLLELRARGHEVTVVVAKADACWEFESVSIQPAYAPRPRADLVICHTDFANHASMIARRAGIPLVGICHNTDAGVRSNLSRIRFDSLVVNSESMRDELHLPEAIVVNPPMRDHRQPRIQ